MADMTFQQIEDAATKKLPVLFPIGVIEEHGPHLPLGTDTYLAYQSCRHVKQALSELGVAALIAPPFYWGINHVTSGFAGSFTVRPETMVDVLCDALVCLKTWGFEQVFPLNEHGDFVHLATILAAVRKAHEELGVGAYFIVPEYQLGAYGLVGDERAFYNAKAGPAGARGEVNQPVKEPDHVVNSSPTRATPFRSEARRVAIWLVSVPWLCTFRRKPALAMCRVQRAMLHGAGISSRRQQAPSRGITLVSRRRKHQQT
jgi:hypothetical protein